MKKLLPLLLLLLASPAWAMEHYVNNVQDSNGRGIGLTTVTVYATGTLTKATIYSDNGTTTKANPTTSDSSGRYDFYAANGAYDLVFARTGYTFTASRTARITLYDVNDGGGGGSGSSVAVDGVTIATPNFTSTADIDFIATGSSVTANINADAVALGTDTTGNYVSSATGSQGLTVTGTEGASVGLQVCTNGQILKNSGGTSWICSADSTGGSPSFDTISSGTNTTMASIVGTGASLTTSGSGAIVATSLAANGANCSAGSGALGVDTAGAAESCTDFMEEPTSTGLVARTAANTASGRTITGTSNAITVTNGDGVSGNPTLNLSSTIDATSKTVRIPNGITLPATCTTGDQYMDTDATTGQRFYLCESTDTWAKQGDGGGGSGTVTNTGGNLTANAVVLGAGTVDTKVVAGIITDGASKVTLGVAGTSVGSVALNNATSGSVTVSPVTGALGTIAIALPAQSGTVVVGALGATANVVPVTSGTGGQLLTSSGCSVASSTMTCPNGFTTGTSGVGTLDLLEGIAPGANVTASHHNLYMNSTGSVLESHENGGSVKTYLYSGGALGTPASGTLTNTTGFPIANLAGAGTGVLTALATPSSANVLAAVTDETGTGALVFGTSPTLTTPTIGVATATSVNKMAITAPATSSTLAVANGKTFTSSNTLTLAGTDSTTITFQATDTYVGRATTDTLTNKTLDCEGTGNVCTIPKRIWLPAAGCNNATAGSIWDIPSSSPAVPACITGTNTQKGVLDFADSVSLSAQLTYALPSTWTGTVDARIKWLTTAIAGDVVWQLSTICVADAETDDPAFNTASTVTDTAKGTTNQTNDAAITTVTVTGCAAGELMHIKILRDAAHASDTLAATARLIGVELVIREAI